MFDDMIESHEEDVRQSLCPNAPSTTKEDSAADHLSRHSEVEEALQTPMYSTLLVIGCIAQPVASSVQSKSTTKPPFWNKEVRELMLEHRERFPSFGILLAKSAARDPRPRVHRVWRGVGRCAAAFYRAMRQALSVGAQQQHQQAQRSLRSSRATIEHQEQKAACDVSTGLANDRNHPVRGEEVE